MNTSKCVSDGLYEKKNIIKHLYCDRRWGSIVGIATGYGLYD
jgi:hypothetical protein